MRKNVFFSCILREDMIQKNYCANFLSKKFNKGLKLLYHFLTKYSVIEKSETSCAQNSNFFQSLVNQNRLNKVRFSFKIANRYFEIQVQRP